MGQHSHSHEIQSDLQLKSQFKKTLIVVVISFITMVIEITYGVLTGSMALTADGIHMLGHVMALGLSAFIYKLSLSENFKRKMTFGSGKLTSLGGYTNSLLLVTGSVWMFIESFKRFYHMRPILYEQAMWVAFIGLVVNLICAFILHMKDDVSHQSDHNYKGAYLHILTDALTSVFALLGLFGAKYFNLQIIDPILGVLGSIIILKWAFSLFLHSGQCLLDFHLDLFSKEDLKKLFHDQIQVDDLHLWQTSPGHVCCEIVLSTSHLRGSDYYRNIISNHYKLFHLTIEENLID